MKVLIIGAGLTGLVAAGQMTGAFSEKFRENRQNIQIEIAGDGSGASPWVHGLNLPVHPQDSVEAFARDTIRNGYGLSDIRLVEALCSDSLSLLSDLKKIGVEFLRKGNEYALLKPLGSTWPRVAGSGNHTGVDIIKRLTAYLKRQENVTFSPGMRALKLDVDEEGVKGAIAWDRRKGRMVYKEASCILLSCGGFCGIYPFSTNFKDSGGDGIAMAYEAGAKLMDLEFVQFEPSVAIYPDSLRGRSVITTMFYEGAVLRNGQMERFMSQGGSLECGECVGKDVLARAIAEEIRKGKGTAHGGVYFDATGVGRKKLEESYASYVERYRKAGMDIAKEPFEIAPAPHTSLGGIRIAPDCSTGVRGLYAAGEIAGGIHGAGRIGGNAGLETFVFGKRAGEAVLKAAEKEEWPAEERKDKEQLCSAFINGDELAREELSAGRVMEIRREMEAVLQENLYLVRNREGTQKAIRLLDRFEEELKGGFCKETPLEKYRLENDLTCAKLLARGAAMRSQSVGCHVREDSDGGDFLYHVMIKKQDGDLKGAPLCKKIGIETS